MVEFALVLPVFLLVLLGMVDMGKAISYWNDQTHLANEAARYAVVDSSPTLDVNGNPVANSLVSALRNQAVTPELKNGSGTSEGVQGSGIQIDICFPSASSAGVPLHAKGDPVKVTVTSTYKWFGFLFGSGVSSTMKGSSTMRLENPYKGDGTDSYTASTTTPCS